MLVRDAKKAEQIKNQYPKVQIVLGNLDDSSILERESAAADIVLRKYKPYKATIATRTP